MKILGIIAEYNPFHLGHQYHLQTAKEITKADAIIAVISSSFMQRGEPAIVDKWARCEMALKAGVDLVLELPTAFSCRSAYWFASGSIKSLAATGLVTHLAFGAESGKLSSLKEIASFLNSEDAQFKYYLNIFLNAGNSFPKARSLTLEKLLGENAKNFLEELNNPNNILALAYLRILEEIDSTIEPVLIKRVGEYHAQSPENGIASASAIRNMISNGNSLWSQYVPGETKNILNSYFEQGKGPVFLDSLEQSILATIRRMDIKEIANIIEVEEGLENRIWELAQSHGNISILVDKLKTKRYTYTRIQRLLIYLLLNFTKQMAFTTPYYLRVLGFSPQGKNLLKKMKDKSSLPIITKFASAYKFLDNQGLKMLDLETRASDLYTLAYPNPFVRQGRQDFYQSPIIKTG